MHLVGDLDDAPPPAIAKILDVFYQVVLKAGADNAEDTKAKTGGIDFAQSNLDMQIKRDGAGVLLPVSRQNLDNIHINGLVPVILSIQSPANVPAFSLVAP